MTPRASWSPVSVPVRGSVATACVLIVTGTGLVTTVGGFSGRTGGRGETVVDVVEVEDVDDVDEVELDVDVLLDEVEELEDDVLLEDDELLEDELLEDDEVLVSSIGLSGGNKSHPRSASSDAEPGGFNTHVAGGGISGSRGHGGMHPPPLGSSQGIPGSLLPPPPPPTGGMLAGATWTCTESWWLWVTMMVITQSTLAPTASSVPISPGQIVTPLSVRSVMNTGTVPVFVIVTVMFSGSPMSNQVGR